MNNIPIDKDIFNLLIKELETSDKGIFSLCKDNNISYKSYQDYLRNNENESQINYARAKEEQIEFQLEKIHDLENELDERIKTEEDPRKCNAIVQTYKLKIDNLKWIASKLKPKKYGDRLDLTTGGKDLPGTISVSFVDNKEAKPAK